MKLKRYFLFFSMLGVLAFNTGVRAADDHSASQAVVVSVEQDTLTVRGVVVDGKDRPINGVAVLVEKSDKIVLTGRDGKFTITARKGAKLTLSRDGWRGKSVKAKFPKEMRIVMLREDNGERMPQFPGGNIQQYISRNIKYPKDAQEMGVEGKVFVQFIVEKDGTLSNIRVLRPVFYSLDQEACRVIREMPRWKPGIQKGKPVRVSYTVPINFSFR